MSDDIELVGGSGNVFADFDHPDAAVEQLKSVLAAQIIHVLDARGLTVRAAADFSRIRRSKLDRFTIDRLMMVLSRLDLRVEVELRFAYRTA
jgi:predicted XRE-type DNA-binding protein